MQSISEFRLHIIAFDVPYPPNYGGVIDVYYKIRALSEAGAKVILHCFEYGRGMPEELSVLCEKVYYYSRQTGLKAHFSHIPYIVNSRKHPKLLQNLLKDEAPILFEGLHTCSLLSSPTLKNRIKIYRESNIEHHYYLQLARASHNGMQKVFFIAESIRLKYFQKILEYASVMCAVSETDTEYLRKHFKGRRVEYLPSFHGNRNLSCLPGKGTYALYHGKLSVAENTRAAEYLIHEVFCKSSHNLVIAGMDPPDSLIRLAAKYHNIRLVASPGKEEMEQLIQDAHIHVLVTFQPTGLKLKLINTLYQGRFCLVNPHMLAGTGLGSLCYQAHDAGEMRLKTDELFQLEFDEREIQKREKILSEKFSDAIHLEKLMNLIHSCQ